MVYRAEWSTGLDLGTKGGWGLTRHREKGGRFARQGHNLRQIREVKTVVLGVRAVVNWSRWWSGNVLGYIEYVRELGRCSYVCSMYELQAGGPWVTIGSQ